MRKNILVTGAKGFIGRNFIAYLNRCGDYTVYEFNRDSSWEELEQTIGCIDFIFHFAGEVRPASSDDDFRESNTNFTKKLLTIIEKASRPIPIVMTSSIHAIYQKNEYGKSKRDAEILIEEYSSRQKTGCWIFRLPHVFGEGCKPNYNSVVSTWIYNSIHDLPINVFDRSAKMHYVYVQDIVEEFYSCMSEKSDTCVYPEMKNVFSTTLGEVVDLLNAFKSHIGNEHYHVSGDEFTRKLFHTYRDYYQAEV